MLRNFVEIARPKSSLGRVMFMLLLLAIRKFTGANVQKCEQVLSAQVSCVVRLVRDARGLWWHCGVPTKNRKNLIVY
jgi:hypothetical protein